MPVRKNPAFGGDPYMAQAAQNVASLFAPEDPSKIAAGALAFQKAQAERDQAARLADLTNLAKGPNPDAALLDRYGVVAGLFKPTESRYAVDTKAATDKYGYETSAAATQNVAHINNAGALARQFQQPVVVGEGQTAYVSDQQRANTEFAPILNGQVTAKQGERVIVPGMGLVEGNTKPQTLDEAKGSAFATLTPQLQQGVVTSGPGTQSIVDPMTGKFRIESNAGAIGMEPAPDPTKADKPLLKNWGLNGRGGQARFVAERGPNGTWVDIGSGNAIPPEAITYEGQAQAAPGEFGKTTEAENKAGYAATISGPPVERILKAFDTGQLPTQTDATLNSLEKMAPDVASPFFKRAQSDQGQLFYQDVSTVLPFELMQRSGAAVNENEYQRAIKMVTPIPGEAPGVTAARRQIFERYLTAVRGVAGAGFPKAQGGGGLTTPAVPTAPAAPTSASAPPAEAVQHLRANPGLTAAFNAKYGAGAAAAALGRQ